VEDVYHVLNDMATRLGGLAIVIANAGVSSRGRVGGGLEAFKNHKECVEINLIGAMATVDAAVEYFHKVGGGHVVGKAQKILAFFE
jgi:short-subunit dehydrogenase